MFGYIKPYTPELKIREWEQYRGVYCGLCRAMGRVSGNVSRLSLNYDFVFLAAVRLLLSEEPLRSSLRRCAVHPIRKRVIADRCDQFDYTASVAVLLLKEKLDDDIKDEKGLIKLRSSLLRPAASHMFSLSERKNSLSYASSDDLSVAEDLNLLSELESSGNTSLDSCAESFGRLTGKLFSAGLDSSAGRVAYEIGKHCGRYIYVADALDDICEDFRRGRFNPITAGTNDAVIKQDGKIYLSEKTAGMVLTAALLDLERLAAAAELACDGGDETLASIVKNIIYLGMPDTLKNIIKKRTVDAGKFQNSPFPKE